MPDDSRCDVERLQSGEPTALAGLVVRHLPGLQAYLRLRMGGLLRAKESCSDLVQSVCREVLGEIGRFEYRGEAAFKHWLYTRARHKLLHRARDLGAQRRNASREQPIDGMVSRDVLDAYRTLATPSRVLAAQEEVARIERAFDALPDDYREAVSMRRMMGLEYAEIAERMGRSQGAVRNLVHRAIARLTIELEAGEGPSS
ncbi:MAG: sigma-70 family RNA polymerase sigma factor [Planctomycetota bacterium]